MLARCLLTVVLFVLVTLSWTGDRAASASRMQPETYATYDSEFTKRHEPPARTIDVHHLRLELAVDLELRQVRGSATLNLSPLGVARDRVTLHAVDLQIDEIRADDQLLGGFIVAPGTLSFELPRAYSPEETVVVEIQYLATPRLGLYFVAPDDEGTPTQVWSQGEMQEHRHWFPAWDEPGDRATSEMLVTVPAGLLAVSNGALVEERENGDGTVTFHWYESLPHVNYLVSLVVGQFAHRTETYRDIPLDYYVPPGREEDIARSFANTADMMRVFEEAFDYPYPYEKYAQITVTDFRWGGMENISATTLTTNTLHDEAAHLTFRSDGLVAHELGHSWFGDLLTCESWREIWLNEGLTTYTEVIYFESKWGEEGRVDRLLDFRDGYLDECADAYRRPLVTDDYAEAEDLFDSHAYEKGGLVMHMLRNVLGEEVFWRGLRHYVRQHAWQTVETAELRMAFEEVSGIDLARFFDQWVDHGGHPQLTAQWSWNGERVVVEVEQAQEVDALTPIFDTPLDLRVTTADGVIERRVRLDERREVFTLPVGAPPVLVQLDPEGWLLAEIDLEQSAAAWLRQLTTAPAVMGRVVAAEALADFIGEPEATAGLGSALLADASRHVRSAAAAALAEIGTDEALEALARGVDDDDARVRRAVASALGGFEDPGAGERAATVLRRLIRDDPSPYVVADAVEALGGTGADGVLKQLEKASRRTSHGDVIRCSAYAGMAALEAEAAIAALEAGCHPDVPWRARAAAIENLGTLAGSLPEHRAAIRARLIGLVGDPHFAARRAAVSALGDTKDPEALSTLRDLARNAYESGLRSRARDGVRQLLAAGEEDADATDERLGELERANDSLRAELEALRRELQPEEE